MINPSNTSRIIGDFIEINADIVKSEFENDQRNKWWQFPIKKFYKLLYKHYRNNLIRLVKKINGLNFVMDRDNIAELFVYIFNNFPPLGQYKEITSSKIDEDHNFIEGVVEFDNIKAFINIDNTTDDKLFNIYILKTYKDGNTNNYHLQLKELSYHVASELIDKINKKLVEIMSDYIIHIISAYQNK